MSASETTSSVVDTAAPASLVALAGITLAGAIAALAAAIAITLSGGS